MERKPNSTVQKGFPGENFPVCKGGCNTDAYRSNRNTKQLLKRSWDTGNEIVAIAKVNIFSHFLQENMWWTLEIDGGPRRVNHASVSIRDRYVFSFGGYCTGEEYINLDKMDIHIFDLSMNILLE